MLNIVQSFMVRRFNTVTSAPVLSVSAAAIKTPMAICRPSVVPVARITPAPERLYSENILVCRRRRARRRANRR